ncbi:M48 family metallopeptidase [Sphingomonas japonica]|uniref:Peptidase M48 domain-containing protein n=1 Tax=Sphingomonas japonica TaxID=511662 RepID=A0ABX0U6R7_9SPHN|nr:M48 family metallopeptidase [Sphingomonas japonica]NIJ25121.1 hypothetical protein [Sphingomonas japonica]
MAATLTVIPGIAEPRPLKPAAAPGTGLDRKSDLRALQAADLRLAGIFYRIAKANAALCQTLVPATGLILHSRSAYLGQYEEAAAELFGFEAAIGVEGVLPGSPAAAFDIPDTSSLTHIAAANVRSATTVQQALRTIEQAGSGGSVDVSLADRGRQRTLRIPTERICAGRVEAQVSATDNAGTDGQTIQVTTELMNRLPEDDQLAAVVAHEFAHIVLDHPDRLTRAGVARGLFREFGRNRRLWRQTEIEADRLSAYLMANAGYDPRAAQRFWLGAGRRVGGGLLASGTHMNARQRAAMLAREAAAIAQIEARPIMPELLTTRDMPLD